MTESTNYGKVKKNNNLLFVQLNGSQIFVFNNVTVTCIR